MAYARQSPANTQWTPAAERQRPRSRLVKSRERAVSGEDAKLRPHLLIRPLPQGRCKIEIDAIVDWDTAIDIMKTLGHLGQIASIQQNQCLPGPGRMAKKMTRV